MPVERLSLLLLLLLSTETGNDGCTVLNRFETVALFDSSSLLLSSLLHWPQNKKSEWNAVELGMTTRFALLEVLSKAPRRITVCLLIGTFSGSTMVNTMEVTRNYKSHRLPIAIEKTEQWKVVHVIEDSSHNGVGSRDPEQMSTFLSDSTIMKMSIYAQDILSL